MFDTHAHYLNSYFGEELEQVLAELPTKGVKYVTNIGCGEDEWEETRILAEKYSWLFTAYGIHPEYAGKLSQDWETELEQYLGTQKTVALGEIGLDYHYEDGAPKDVQKAVFVKQLELAKRLGLPVIIHSRDACADTMEILREYKPRGVMHCFSYSAEIAAEVVKLGMYVGFTGVLTFKNSKKAKAACEVVPLDRLLLETDCPFMAPVPFRGKRCDSSMIRFTAEAMAACKNVSPEKMIEVARENGKRFYGIRE